MKSENTKDSEDFQDLEMSERVLEIFKNYSEASDYPWPWEALRWYELIFSILDTIGEPQVLAVSIRDLTYVLADFGLLEVGELSKLTPTDDQAVTINTLLVKAGFTPEQAKSALRAVCEAASGIQKNYGGRIQDYYSKYGEYMMQHINADFAFSDFDDAPKAIAIWLQSTLNMPIPGSNLLADKACEKLGITYDQAVGVAKQKDMNIAQLDNALRAYWEDNIMKVPQKP
jgi:hypothetical protein